MGLSSHVLGPPPWRCPEEQMPTSGWGQAQCVRGSWPGRPHAPSLPLSRPPRAPRSRCAPLSSPRPLRLSGRGMTWSLCPRAPKPGRDGPPPLCCPRSPGFPLLPIGTGGGGEDDVRGLVVGAQGTGAVGAAASQSGCAAGRGSCRGVWISTHEDVGAVVPGRCRRAPSKVSHSGCSPGAADAYGADGPYPVPPGATTLGVAQPRGPPSLLRDTSGPGWMGAPDMSTQSLWT